MQLGFRQKRAGERTFPGDGGLNMASLLYAESREHESILRAKISGDSSGQIQHRTIGKWYFQFNLLIGN